MVKLDYKIARSMSEVLRKLNKLMRWSYIQGQSKYNELNKQALNCIIVYILACYAEEVGRQVNWKNFPKVAIYRAFQKVYVKFDSRESKLESIREIGGFKPNVYDEATYKITSAHSNGEWAKFLLDCIGTTEYDMYKAAAKIATYIELLEHKSIIDSETYMEKRDEVLKELTQYKDIPGVVEILSQDDTLKAIYDISELRNKYEYKFFKVIKEVSTLKNHNRWCEQSYSVNCSVLGHLFDTACYAYFMSLEKYHDEELAAKHFFMGIFHDVAEAWTGDLPSPIKDKIEGYRDATEKYEEKMLQEKFYSRLPSFLEEKIKEVMFEEPENEKHFKMIKGADYLAADLECYKQYVAGTAESYFLGAMRRRIIGIKNGKVELTEIGMKLYKYFMRKAEARLYNELDYGELRLLCTNIFNEYAFEDDSKRLSELCSQLKDKVNRLDEDELVDVQTDIFDIYFGSSEMANYFLSLAA